MKINFTKMQGAGNDFVVIDETKQKQNLTQEQYRWIGHRQWGIGADQILTIRPAPDKEHDFEYIIHNGADGKQVEHCGNGARCFMKYITHNKLTEKTKVKVKVQKGTIELTQENDGRITVDMGAPEFRPEELPFLPEKTKEYKEIKTKLEIENQIYEASIISMGNPHAVIKVDDVEDYNVEKIGAALQKHPAFPNKVNAGFMQILDKENIKLRVYERGAGETLACGTGACAAAVAAIKAKYSANKINIHTRGGVITINWSGEINDSVKMTGPAEIVFTGSAEIPKDLSKI